MLVNQKQNQNKQNQNKQNQSNMFMDFSQYYEYQQTK